VALFVAMLEIVSLAAAPAWHEAAHHHEGEHGDHGDQYCAATLFATDSWLDAPLAPMLVPELAIQPDEVVTERQRIVSSFRFSGILEHAPPRRA